MSVPRSILVPVDFSDYSEAALDYAVALAAKLDAKLHLVHALGIPGLGVPELGVALTSSLMDQMVKDNQAAIDKLAQAHRTEVPIGNALLRTGDARDVIVQTADELGADLIVMGTHGRRGVSRALLGSVAETVVRTAPCPVLIVHKS